MLNNKDMAGENIRELRGKGLSEEDAIKKVAGLTSMKRTKKDTKKSKDLCCPTSCGPTDAYPYGLQVRLENESLDKLDLDSLPKVGTKLTLTAEVEVSSVSERDNSGSDGPFRSLELQITKMSLA